MQKGSTTKNVLLLKDFVQTTLTWPVYTKPQFTIRGYQTFRMDREGRHKGGVLILVKNSIPARDFKVDTNQQAEIHGVNITVDNTVITN